MMTKRISQYSNKLRFRMNPVEDPFVMGASTVVSKSRPDTKGLNLTSKIRHVPKNYACVSG